MKYITPHQLGSPVKTKKIKKAYAIVSKREGLLFGRVDNEFYGTIWIYPSRKIAMSHCGSAGRVVSLEIRWK